MERPGGDSNAFLVGLTELWKENRGMGPDGELNNNIIAPVDSIVLIRFVESTIVDPSHEVRTSTLRGYL
jgi:hypothetical protein